MDGETLTVGADFSDVDKAVDAAVAEFSKLGEAIQADLTNAMVVVSRAVDSMFEGMTQASEAAWTAISSGAEAALGGIRAAAEATWAAVTGGASVMLKYVSSGFSLLLSPVKAVFSGIWGVVKGAVGLIQSAFSRAFGFIKSTLSGLYDIVKDLLPLAGIGLFAGLAVGVKELLSTEAALTRVSAIVKSTGGVAGFTVQQLQALADQMAETTRFGDDLALSAQAVALQFKNVRGDVFKQALQLGADKAVADMQDLAAATEYVAKALDDPLEASKRLKQEGVKLSDQQKQQIEWFMQMGQTAKAQQVILDALSATFGGQAAADVKTFGGAVAQVNNAMGDAWKAIAGALIPALKPLVEWFKQGADALASWAPVVSAVVDKLMGMFDGAKGVLQEWIDWGMDQFGIWGDWIIDKVGQAAAVIMVAIPNAIEFVKVAIKAIGPAFEWVHGEAAIIFENTKNLVVDAFNWVADNVRRIWKELMQFLDDSFGEKLDSILYEVDKMMAGLSPTVKKFAGIEVTAQGAEDSKANREMERRIEKRRREPNQRFEEQQASEKKAADDETEAAKREARMLELRKSVMAARDAMAELGNFQGPDFEGWQQRADQFKGFFEDLMGDAKESADTTAKESADAFAFNKGADEDKGSGSSGGFVGLEELQKKIQGAAATKSDETKALDKQTALMIQQHNENKKHQEKLEAKLEKPKVELGVPVGVVGP